MLSERIGAVYVTPLRGHERERGLVSSGMNPQCKGQDYSYRVDRAPVLSWINDPNRPDAG